MSYPPLFSDHYYLREVSSFLPSSLELKKVRMLSISHNILLLMVWWAVFSCPRLVCQDCRHLGWEYLMCTGSSLPLTWSLLSFVYWERDTRVMTVDCSRKILGSVLFDRNIIHLWLIRHSKPRLHCNCDDIQVALHHVVWCFVDGCLPTLQPNAYFHSECGSIDMSVDWTASLTRHVN